MLVIAITLLLIAANGAPVLAAKLLDSRFGWRVDRGKSLADGMPLFGASKTWRGILASLLLTVAVALVFGFSWALGLTVALGAMFGDLLSSFAKRRLGMGSSAKASVLDQLPEALIPALLLNVLFGYSWATVLLAAVLFVLADVMLSPLLFRWGLRRVPH